MKNIFSNLLISLFIGAMFATSAAAQETMDETSFFKLIGATISVSRPWISNSPDDDYVELNGRADKSVRINFSTLSMRGILHPVKIESVHFTNDGLPYLYIEYEKGGSHLLSCHSKDLNEKNSFEPCTLSEFLDILYLNGANLILPK